jgi:hypothetical protein
MFFVENVKMIGGVDVKGMYGFFLRTFVKTFGKLESSDFELFQIFQKVSSFGKGKFDVLEKEKIYSLKRKILTKCDTIKFLLIANEFQGNIDIGFKLGRTQS